MGEGLGMGRGGTRAVVAALLVGVALVALGCARLGSAVNGTPTTAPPLTRVASASSAAGRGTVASATPRPTSRPPATATLPAAWVLPTPVPTASVPEPTGNGPLPIPVRVQIPKIGVNAPVETVGLESDGAMGVPRNFRDVGWYGYSPIPGDAGASVLAGHVDWAHGPAVFWSLRDLRPGDVILVDLVGGQTRRFVVDGSGSYPYNEAPVSAVFSWSGPARLTLITCDGVFDPGRRIYDRRLVVFAHADPGSPRQAAGQVKGREGIAHG